MSKELSPCCGATVQWIPNGGSGYYRCTQCKGKITYARKQDEPAPMDIIEERIKDFRERFGRFALYIKKSGELDYVDMEPRGKAIGSDDIESWLHTTLTDLIMKVRDEEGQKWADLIEKKYPNDTIDAMVRDFTTAIPKPKSEVRDRINQAVAEAIEKTRGEDIEAVEMHLKSESWEDNGGDPESRREAIGYNDAIREIVKHLSSLKGQ